MNQLLHQKSWRFIDQSISLISRTPLESFAMDDTLCHLVGQGFSEPTIRTWVHDHTVVLGIQDHRLPYVQEGMKLLERRGYDSIVRNSGGLAVVLDAGVLNISLVLSEKDHAISINNGYDAMVDLVKNIFPEIATEIKAYEIVGSYCPGSYDLSIEGRKFAGISQRRIRQGIAVQIYLCIEGSGSERAELIRDFYQAGLKNEKTKFAYPEIQPSVMASISELSNKKITVYETVMNIKKYIQSIADMKLESLQQEELEYYKFYLNRVLERNKKMLESYE